MINIAKPQIKYWCCQLLLSFSNEQHLGAQPQRKCNFNFFSKYFFKYQWHLVLYLAKKQLLEPSLITSWEILENCTVCSVWGSRYLISPGFSTPVHAQEAALGFTSICWEFVPWKMKFGFCRKGNARLEKLKHFNWMF